MTAIERLATPSVAAKGLPPEATGLSCEEIVARGWNVAAGDLPLPLATLARSAVAHNIAVMARWCAEHGALLAPHGKTTLAPELLHRQLAAGAWGITVTTARHAALAVAAGARRLIVANELVDPVDLRALAALTAAHRLEVLVFVDSEAGLARLDEVAAAAAPGRIAALVEMGLEGGRTGVRTEAELLALLASIRDSGVALAGVSAFEGLIRIARDGSEDQALRRFLQRVAAAVRAARAAGLLDADAIVSAGGSAAFDHVVEHLGGLAGPLILRSGCYVTHDHGLYAGQSPLQLGAGLDADHALVPAISVWAHVISAPEPGAVVAGFGRRDAGHDAGLPVPLARVTGRGARAALSGWRTEAIWDQHTSLRASAGATPLAVGDVLTFGISHPCTTLDKWRTLVEIDDADTVIGLLDTWF